MSAGDVGLFDDLTIILTLKGREDYTPRWLDYHSRAGLQWPVIVGDGAPIDENEALFARASALRTSYRRYDDRNLLAYCRKLQDLVAAARTSYVMLSDNDDFVLPDGVLRSIRFLEDHSDYVSCSGAILGVYITDYEFAETDRLFGGTFHNLRSIYNTLVLNDVDSEARATQLLRSYVPTWYAVHRRDALLKAFSDIVERKIADVGVMELSVAVELAALGKQKLDGGYASYLRQLNSSQGAAASGGLFARVLSPSLERDIDAVVLSLANIVGGGHAKDVDLIPRLRTAIASYRESRLTTNVNPAQHLLRSVARCSYTVRAKVPVLRPLFSWLEMRKVLAGLRRSGATEESIVMLRRSLDLIWQCAGYRAPT